MLSFGTSVAIDRSRSDESEVQVMTGIPLFKGMDIKSTHPCFSKEAHHKFGRIHLPVAPACNIQCRYCIREYDCANESRPGITSRVLKPHEALERVEAVLFEE